MVLVSGPNTRFVHGWWLEAHGLAISKLVAGRPTDIDFVRIAAREGYVLEGIIEQRFRETKLEAGLAHLLRARVLAFPDESPQS